MVKVLLVDDHELVRAGIERLLAGSKGIAVAGVASSGEEAIALCDELSPDVVLMDIQMPGIGGIEASRKISQKHPGAKIIALSALADGPIPQHLLSTGVQGYVSKSCSIAELVKAVEAVHAGKRYLSADVANALALSRFSATPDGSPFERLSRREMQIALLILQGKDVAEIAEWLKISPKTVSTYRYRLYSKLEVKNDVELVRLSLKHNLHTEPA